LSGNCCFTKSAAFVRLQPLLLQRPLHAFVSVDLPVEALQVCKTAYVDFLEVCPAQHHVQIGVGDGAFAGEPVAAFQLFVQDGKERNQTLFGFVDQGLLEGFVFAVELRREYRGEVFVYVGVDEGQPASCFSAFLNRCAVQPGLRVALAQVFQNGDVLRQGQVAVHQRGYRAGRVDCQISRCFQFGVLQGVQFVVHAHPFHGDLRNERAGTCQVVQLHGLCLHRVEKGNHITLAPVFACPAFCLFDSPMPAPPHLSPLRLAINGYGRIGRCVLRALYERGPAPFQIVAINEPAPLPALAHLTRFDSTHGAFGALAHGIGTSEVEHVLATQCLVAKKMKNMQVRVEGTLPAGVTAKDIVLAVIGQIGTAGGTGHALEFAGSTIRALSVEGRMTLCNMAIEAGARVGLVAVDEKTIDYVKGRPLAPKGENWDKAVALWQTLVSDQDARFDKVIELRAEAIKPQVSWGTSPEMVLPIDECLPDPAGEADPVKQDSIRRALNYMGLSASQPITAIKLDKVFIGSCTNSRIEDLREAARVAKGRKVAANVKLAMVVPGSGLVKAQAEAEGLDKIFVEAGFEWREPGCSMCLAMNPDKLESGEHCASTSNRNFEGRQGAGGRTHLVSPGMAAAAAVAGHFVDVRQYL